MYDSPTMKVELSHSREVTRVHQTKKSNAAGDKDEFQKRIEEKLKKHEREPNQEQKWSADTVELGESEVEPEQKKDDKNKKSSAKEGEPVGDLGKSLDLTA